MIPALGRWWRQVDFFEFEASLIYIGCSRPAKVI